MKTWADRPTEADLEAVVGDYFSLLRARSLSAAEQLVEYVSDARKHSRHVLRSLWRGSVEASVDVAGDGRTFAADEWEYDLSWLNELDLGDFIWAYADDGIHFYVYVNYRGRRMEVALSFWAKPTGASWVLMAPSELW
ncbi:hypothetical protein ACIO6T_37220 [Streptomyces sp. NPDC087532]|uniref:hypothetical protein n=1 Tax=unclassified Streptomyces TaxID=2593676 RepID=UPI003328736E